VQRSRLPPSPASCFATSTTASFAIGERTLATLRAELGGVSGIVDVRGRGCLIGIELASISG
jgi:4-aminobutyrate aminotransferase-like enzyme